MRLVLPYPPSANRYWRVYRGRAVKSPEARAYQLETAKRLKGMVPVSGVQVAVRIDVYRPAKRGDLDNSLKVVLDAIQGFAYLNDKQVRVIIATQHDDKARPRVEVDVRALESWVHEVGDFDASDYERPARRTP